MIVVAIILGDDKPAEWLLESPTYLIISWGTALVITIILSVNKYVKEYIKYYYESKKTK